MNAIALKDERRITVDWNFQRRIDGEDEICTSL